MNTPKKWLIIIYCSLVLLKIFFATFIQSPTIFGDEYLYAKAARSLFYDGTLTVHEYYLASYPPLYSLFLAPAYLLKDMTLIYFLMKIINALLSSFIIVPAYLLWREFFDKKKSLLGALLTGIMPFSFSITPYLMAENLFPVFFLFTLYFIFKSVTTPQRYGLSILAGVFIALTTLTKFTGFILLFFIGLMLCFFLIKKQFDYVKKLAVTIGIASLILGSWLALSAGAKIATLTRFVDSTITQNVERLPFQEIILLFVVWILIYAFSALLGTGVLPTLFLRPPASTHSKKEQAFFWISILFIGLLIIILAKRTVGLQIKEVTPFLGFTGRIIGRYLDFTLPLLVLLGFISLNNKRDDQTLKKTLWFWSGITLTGFLLWYFPLFPFNNTSLTLFGLLKVAINFILTGVVDTAYVSLITVVILTGILLGLFFVAYRLRTNINFYTLFWCLILFFAFTNVGSIFATTYNAHLWSESEQLELSKWLSHEIDISETVLIDETFCGTPLSRENYERLCTKNRQISYVGFWLNNDLVVGSPNREDVDYIITREVLDKQLIRETSHGIFVYKQ